VQHSRHQGPVAGACRGGVQAPGHDDAAFGAPRERKRRGQGGQHAPDPGSPPGRPLDGRGRLEVRCRPQYQECRQRDLLFVFHAAHEGDDPPLGPNAEVHARHRLSVAAESAAAAVP
ncbi:unnamed protein product, partial [Symbiodinium sp. KB8]